MDKYAVNIFWLWESSVFLYAEFVAKFVAYNGAMLSVYATYFVAVTGKLAAFPTRKLDTFSDKAFLFCVFLSTSIFTILLVLPLQLFNLEL